MAAIIEATEYCIVAGDTLHYLEEAVSEKMKIGWQPHGNLVPTGLRFDCFAQPMVKVGVPYQKPPLSNHTLPLKS